MNLLIFPEYPYPTNHVFVESVYERLLPQCGHTVHMIRPAHNIVDLDVRLSPWGSGSLVLFPCKSPGGALENLVRNFRRKRWLSRAIETLAHFPLDGVVVRNDLLTAQAALAFARRRGIPFIFQVSSPDAEFRMRGAGQGCSLAHVYARLRGYQDLRTRRQICQHAQVVLAISPAMRHYMIQTERISEDRVFSFPMGFNQSSELTLEQQMELRARLKLAEGRTLVYSGVLDPVRKSCWMLDVLKRVNEKLPEAVLLVLTGQVETDPRRREFEREAAMRGAQVRVIGPLTHGEVGEYLQCADLMISPINPIFEYRISSPTKTIEALGVGLPVVGNVEVEEHATILNHSGGGVAVPWDIDIFAGAVVNLLNDPGERRRMGVNGRSWAQQNRTYERLTDYLDSILQGADSLDTLKKLSHLSEN